MSLHNLNRRLEIIRAMQGSHVDRCRALAMLAKEAVFLAQDEAEHVDDPRLHAELRAYLNNARADLESLDLAIADREARRRE